PESFRTLRKTWTLSGLTVRPSLTAPEVLRGHRQGGRKGARTANAVKPREHLYSLKNLPQSRFGQFLADTPIDLDSDGPLHLAEGGPRSTRFPRLGDVTV